MIEIKKFDTCPQGQVDAITLSSEKLSFTVLSYGATIQKILFCDKNGTKLDLCQGYDTVKEYMENEGYFGAAIGRNGNRIGNAQYTYGGKTYQLRANEGKNQLHGGLHGLNEKLFTYKTDENSVTFQTRLLDGEEGFPGNIDISIRYSIDKENGLRIDYSAVCDADTVANLTNHCYFNLNGAGSGTILGHTLWLDADRFTLTDLESIPTGELPLVENTCMDFRKPKKIGDDIGAELLKPYLGFDHNWCLNGTGLRKVAHVAADVSGIAMDVETTLEGVQFYSGNYIVPGVRKDGKRYEKQYALCLETQHYPDAVNHPEFPSPILKKGEKLAETTIYRFGLQ